MLRRTVAMTLRWPPSVADAVEIRLSLTSQSRSGTADQAEAREGSGKQSQARGFGNPFCQRQDRVANERLRRRSRVNSIPEQILRRIAPDKLSTGIGYVRQPEITRMGH